MRRGVRTGRRGGIVARSGKAREVRNMMGASSVMGVHCMRRCRCSDVMLEVRMRQKEKCWWCWFGVVVFLGEERASEIMRGLRW